jgi:formate hydrogenlyase subunit 4
MTVMILLIISACIIPGVIIRTKSIASGRKGPGIFQPVKEVMILLRKGSVFSTTSGIIFQIAPVISLSCTIGAMLVLPFGGLNAVFPFDGDFIFFTYMLALGRFFAILSALDTGSSFEGMGANREAFFSMLAEPAFFILLATFAMFTGHTSFSGIFSHFFIAGSHYILIYSIIGFYLIIQTAMIENSRLPVDDPKTHLELTMVHEVMILDNSGFDKALIHIGSYFKFAIYGSLLFNVIAPSGWSIFLKILLYLAVQVLFAVIIGLTESFRARNKMNRNPKYILTLSAIAWIAFVIILILTDKLT